MTFDDANRPLHWGNVTDAFVDDLARRLAGRRVLEVFSGNGYLASRLREAGVDVVATTLFAAHDGHDHGMRGQVVEMDCRRAIREFGHDRDVLLMCWPNTTEAAALAIAEWGPERPVIYVGEMPIPGLPYGGYPSCASDFFFEIVRVEEDVAGYEPRSVMDKAVVLRLDFDRYRAAVLRRAEVLAMDI